ncbi:calponin homology domain-containing protein [Reichenbachiella agarivorans]|uniref:Calponin homology domain-containing protein n=1 Tax=Reichenbachiella agarivorans TaxID=2979464 RepID=A0ABY6CW88_9BACT|nr:calponin homology domain-containing protein [Reichenbachiella agarivorans]UXP33658.1 calponin homology domain-containing protein [Reichenbachiella agarivorans]
MNALIRILIILLFFIKPLCAISLGDVTEHVEKSYAVQQKKSFSNLDPFSHLADETESSYFMEGLYEPVSVDDELLRAKIDATYEEVAANNRFVKFLDSNALIELPVGIKTSIGSLDYVILIDSVVSTPEYSLLYASMSFETPKTGRIHFRGEGIRFSKKGGIEGGGTLFLVGDYPSQTEENQSKDKTQLIIRGKNNKTFVEFDCNGFKQFGLEASLVFSNKTILPEDQTGKILENQNVSVDFTTSVSDWNDILVEVGIDPFQVKGLDGVSFSITNAVIDLSDTRNLPGVSFPAEYIAQSPFHQSGNPNLWRGVFIQSLTIALPHQFDTKSEGNATERVRLTGQNMLIDDLGFTGIISGENLIPLEKGKLGNWNFSLDMISVKLVANELTEGGLKGKIDIPLKEKEGSGTADENKLFAYSAMMKMGGEYLFNVSSPEEISFDLFKAGKVTLLPSSYVEVKSIDGKFLPSANLNGKMDIMLGLNSENGDADSNAKKNISLEGITFQDLKIQSVKP